MYIKNKRDSNNIKVYSPFKPPCKQNNHCLEIIEEMFKNFNDIGYALGYVTKKAAYDEQMEGLNEQVKNISDRNQKAKAKNILKNTTAFREILKEEGLQLDDEYLKQMAYLLNYGYNQQFEIQMPLDDFCLFSAQLDRDNLKDKERTIIKKYSRETEKEFVLFGIITQIDKESNRDSLLKNRTQEWGNDEEDGNMKEAIMNVVRHLTNVEKTFTGKLDYEFIIDPISMYIEL